MRALLRLVALSLLLLPLLAWGGTNVPKTGAQATYQAPLRNPNHPAVSDPKNDDEYGLYTIADIIANAIRPVLDLAGYLRGSDIGTGSGQVAAGNDARFPTTAEKAAIPGTSGTPVGSNNRLVDNADTGTSGAGKVLRLDGQGRLPALDGSQLQNLPAGGGGGVSSYNDLTDKPTLGTAAAKNVGTAPGNVPELVNDGSGGGSLAISGIDLPTADDYKVNGQPLSAVIGGSGVSSWNDLTDKPLVFPPDTHTHPIGQVDGLQAALDAKAAQTTIDTLEDQIAALIALMENHGIDTTAPTVAITSSTADTTSSSYTLTATATDNVGVTAGSVKYKLNGGTLTDMSGTGPYSASLTLTPGANTLYVEAKDDAGNAGTASGSITYTPPDTSPDAFSFVDQTDVATSAEITSAAITVAGINSPATISVTGGTYDINSSGTFVSTVGTVSNGDTVRARHTSSASNSTATNTTVTIGGVQDTFTSTTEAAALSCPASVIFNKTLNAASDPNDNHTATPPAWNGTPTYVAGQSGNAAQMASGTFMSMDSDELWSTSGRIGAWVRYDGGIATSNNFIRTNGGLLELRSGTTASTLVGVLKSGVQSVVVSAASAITQDVWAFYEIAFNISGTTATVTIYKDGVQVGTNSGTMDATPGWAAEQTRVGNAYGTTAYTITMDNVYVANDSTTNLYALALQNGCP